MATYLLTLEQVASLFEYLESHMNQSGCDQSFTHTKQWLAINIPQEQHEAILSEMEALGGYCDCEVLMNCYEEYEDALYRQTSSAIQQQTGEGAKLIEIYLANLQEIHNMTMEDFGNRQKVSKGNKLANTNRRIASDIEEKYPDQKEAFAKLLSHDSRDIRGQVAHHMLEVMNYPTEYRKKALDEIKDVIDKNIPIESFGNNIWLDQWYKEHPEDRLL